ncbi:uncharacterized protein LOC124159701 [Ischnura elegans]|uniref:uncharacterized protein LOC124159701 n=1 Tax=Ischnura elegans TaxID=197161 RepID=UPI001ED89B12|nr:uncharacterized protein LOC124159701 [Ischnura elegans]
MGTYPRSSLAAVEVPVMMDAMTSKLLFWLFFLISAERISSYQDCNSWERNEVSDSIFLPNGTVLDPDGRTLYPLGSYWAELYESSFSVHHCPCSLQGPCLRKCCLKDQVMDYDTHECKVHDDPWPWFRPIVVSDFKGNLGRAENDHFRLVFGKHCEGRFLTHPRDGYGFFLNFTDGTLNLPDRVGEALGPDEFCLEYVPKSEAYLPFLCLEPLEPDMKLLESKCPAWERSEITNPVFMPNGSVWDESMKLLYPLDSYWTDVVNESMVIYGCPCGLEKPCLRKCCGKDEAMEFDQLYCIPYAESRVKTNGRSVDYEISGWFRPNVTSDVDGEVSVASGDHFALIYGNYCWGFPLEPKMYPEDAFFLNFSDGTLNVLKGNLRMGPDEFCMEYYPIVDDYLPYKCFYKLGGTEETKKAINYCYKVRYILYPVAFSVSIFFLFVSLFVYLILPDLRNMHGKCLICHMISALVAFVALAAVQGFGTHFGESVCWASVAPFAPPPKLVQKVQIRVAPFEPAPATRTAFVTCNFRDANSNVAERCRKVQKWQRREQSFFG